MKKRIGSLNDDILFNVLRRLPTKTLLGLKCVSKGWCHLTSDRSFIQAQLLNMEPILSGFIFQERFKWCNKDINTISFISLGTEQKVHRMVFSFLPEDVVVLASCNGLVCCRSCNPTQDPAIYVCNPSNKEWVRFEWTDYDKHASIGLAFDQPQSPFDISAKYNVVRVKQFHNDYEKLFFTFEIFSSETGEWRKSNEICHCNNNLIKNKGIYIGGVLHWLTDGDEILTFSVDKELAWLISVPVPAVEFKTVPEACIGESEGKLHYIMITEEGLQVWYLEDYYESKWTLKHSKSLAVIEEQYSKFFCNLHKRVTQRLTADMNPWMDPLVFKDGLLLLKVSAKLYFYHIENSKMQDVCTIAELAPNSIFCPTVLPYSLSLVPLIQS
ncbi:F-box protein [Quillaja saponaria]|uniref:F-box protein n=1 Tax=Quillaja saponaria TaxID=32244 RepID=A0AAD7Q5V9_QUISA|nr:F-box protein [Quillaja saponaria]KAJ7975359.1 F-box protein [Quillaja saponaria]